MYKFYSNKVQFIKGKIYEVGINPLSSNFTKWSNTLKQFVNKLPTNCVSVFDRFVGLALKGLISILGFVLVFTAVLRLLFSIFSFFTFPLWFLFVLQNFSIEIKISSFRQPICSWEICSQRHLSLLLLLLLLFFSLPSFWHGSLALSDAFASVEKMRLIMEHFDRNTQFMDTFGFCVRPMRHRSKRLTSVRLVKTIRNLSLNTGGNCFSTLYSALLLQYRDPTQRCW